ncbi:MAG: LemA family protein [Armatimonadetes bacterium]|nr:LemA family protein [Armatimonadota bacterium]
MPVTGIWIGCALLAALLAWVLVVYNRLVRLRVLARNAWSDIDVQLKRRHDLVPNLVETVKGYAAHEQGTLERVVQARHQAMSVSGPRERSEAENALTQALRHLFVLVEAYPDLKANQGFLQLQSDLTSVEEDIANARRYYNAVVRDFNTESQTFPAVLIARGFGFTELSFFGATEDERKAVSIQLQP